MVGFYGSITFFIFLSVSVFIWALKPMRASGPHLRFSFLWFMLIGLLTAAGYVKMGQYSSLITQQMVETEKTKLKAKLIDGEYPNEVVERFQSILRDNPDSIEGWYLLGKLFFSQGEFQKGINCLEKAHELEPKNTVILNQYIQLVFMNNNMKLGELGNSLIKKVFLLDPQNKDANHFLALDAFNQKQYTNAARKWQEILNNHILEAKEHETIIKAINKCKEFGAKGISTIGQPVIRIHIDVDDEVKSHIKRMPQATLFVSAKLTNGPPMPLAVKRIDKPAFPLDLTLSRKDRMLPNHQLTISQDIKIGVKLTKENKVDSEGIAQVESDIKKIDAETQVSVTMTTSGIA